MAYRVTLSQGAAKALKKLDAQQYARVRQELDSLAENPRPSGAKALQGGLKGALRIRVGDHRIMYEVDDTAQAVFVSAIGDRKEIYR